MMDTPAHTPVRSSPAAVHKPTLAMGRAAPPRVVVVGGGIAGMGAALGLARAGASVTLIEAAELGGACCSVQVPLTGREPLTVDLGVSDFNRATFARVTALLGELNVTLDPVCQDASFRSADGSWLWSSSPGGCSFAADVDGSFSTEIVRFRAEVPAVTDPRLSAGEWLREHGFSADFRRLYFAPRARGCFPAPGTDPLAMPIRALARFWGMHGLVGPGPADRLCVRGGMHRYVPVLQAKLQQLGVRLRLGERVQRIERGPLRVHTWRDVIEPDHLVLATDPAVALRLLARPSATETAALRACRVQRARVVMHRDVRLMPSDPARWAAYNYALAAEDAPPRPTITFFPERLAGLARQAGSLPPLFVTLNPTFEPRHVLAEKVLSHPVLGRDDAVALALARLQGEARTWYCGAWTAEPFLHEQGLASGLDVAAAITAQHDARCLRRAA